VPLSIKMFEIKQVFGVDFDKKENEKVILETLHLTFLPFWLGSLVFDYLHTYHQQHLSRCFSEETFAEYAKRNNLLGMKTQLVKPVMRFDACSILDISADRYHELHNVIITQFNSLFVLFYPPAKRKHCFDYLFSVDHHQIPNKNKKRDPYFIWGGHGACCWSTLCSFSRFGLSRDPQKFTSEKRQSLPCRLPFSREEIQEIQQSLEIFQDMVKKLKWYGQKRKRFKKNKGHFCETCCNWTSANRKLNSCVLCGSPLSKRCS
jgi:hypothetical protein